MEKFRLETSHLLMLSMISCGTLGIGYWVLPYSVWYLVLLLVVSSFIAWIFLYQKKSYESSEVPPVDALSNQAETNLAGLLEHMPMGVVQFDPVVERVIWFNPYAALLLTTDSGEFDDDLVFKFLAERQEKNASPFLAIGDKKFTVSVDKTKQMFYFWDTRSAARELEGLTDFSPVIAILSVDNYDDLTDTLSDAEISQINSFVASFIASFAGKNKIFYRRMSMDRFYLFTDYFVLSQLIQDKFKILTDFRQAAKEQDFPLTLSMGISYGSHDHEEIGKTAQSNLNLAMIRGGDQIVLRENDPTKSYQYFGGGSGSTVKRSRTRTRAMMSAISDKLRLADRVFVVGHKNTDMDALAAAVGMQFFASQLPTEAYVVYDPTSQSRDVAAALEGLASEEGNKLLTVDEARPRVSPRSLLIMVDHSKLSLTLSKSFYEQFREVIVVDHHRRDDDFPTNASLSFIESGASSASELVTELIQFQNASQRMSRLQASILMAGIMLDTKNFTSRVTGRTFDVASYLRRHGSDNQVIQALSAQPFDEYRQVNTLVLAGEPFGESLMIAHGQEKEVYSNVVTSKAADTLLAMAGIEASFVVTRKSREQVAISARSKQEVNVQRIMERLGGGGHFNLAAAQLEGKTIQEAVTLLQEAIKEETKE